MGGIITTRFRLYISIRHPATPRKDPTPCRILWGRGGEQGFQSGRGGFQSGVSAESGDTGFPERPGGGVSAQSGDAGFPMRAGGSQSGVSAQSGGRTLFT